MTDQYALVQRAADFLRERVPDLPSVAVVLGSGLGDFADALQHAVTIPYAEIPQWPASAVVGHAGTLVVGSIAGKRVAALSGRAWR